MYRAIALAFALGLTPVLAEDLGTTGAPILDDISALCSGPCPESNFTAMSSDLDGDGAAEFLDAEIALAEIDCAPELIGEAASTCSMEIAAEGAL